MTFRITESATREEWLENRRECLTGTDIADLMTGGAKTWDRVRASKLGLTKDFDNKYMSWGREREPHIAEFVQAFVDSRLTPNDKFLINDDLGIGCTPDMLGGIQDEFGLVADVVGEIKTSKHPMPDLVEDKSWMKYRVQTQVELMVTGAERLIFAWEQHDDDWPSPVPYDIQYQIIAPDRELQSGIMETVERYNEGDTPIDVDVARIIHKLRHLNLAREDLNAQDKVLRDELQSLLKVGDKLSHDGVSVSYYEPSKRSGFDTKAFKEAHPDLASEYTATTTGKPTLRLTFPKGD